jgi:hypothetical protein
MKEYGRRTEFKMDDVGSGLIVGFHGEYDKHKVYSFVFLDNIRSVTHIGQIEVQDPPQPSEQKSVLEFENRSDGVQSFNRTQSTTVSTLKRVTLSKSSTNTQTYGYSVNLGYTAPINAGGVGGGVQQSSQWTFQQSNGSETTTDVSTSETTENRISLEIPPQSVLKLTIIKTSFEVDRFCDGTTEYVTVLGKKHTIEAKSMRFFMKVTNESYVTEVTSLE